MTRGSARALGVAGFVAMAAAHTAQAEVFEIGDDGSLRTRAATAAVAWTGENDQADNDDGSIEVAPDVPPAALSDVELPKVPAAYASMLADAARRYDLSPALLEALVARESAWQQGVVSKKGAIGLGQLMPATARALAVDPRNAAANLDGAARYLRQLLDMFDGNVERALAAYNSGPARVLKANGVPPIRETQLYVSAIIDRLASGSRPNSMGEVR